MSPLYLREITYRAYVLCDDELHAGEYDQEILEDAIDPDDQGADLVEPGSPLIHGYTPQCLVYHNGDSDITVAEALAQEAGE